MRGLGFVVLLVLSTIGWFTDARADVEYPYCLVPSLYTVGTCTYATLEQCQAAASGNAGSCSKNSRYVEPAPVRQRRRTN